ncbi:hypothetical protein B0T09DRAFT_22139 [Sordaria sp. MPI-SDFR-AT-0083]|nr:hypothetical protein B0T09DRAFT_22139 [Sordaria sp. MPI-SDFR-AT-0083]
MPHSWYHTDICYTPGVIRAYATLLVSYGHMRHSWCHTRKTVTRTLPTVQGLGSQGSAELQTLGMSLMNARRPQAARLNLTLARLSATGIAYPSPSRRLQASEPTIKLPTTLVSEMRQSPVITEAITATKQGSERPNEDRRQKKEVEWLKSLRKIHMYEDRYIDTLRPQATRLGTYLSTHQTSLA